MKTPPNSIHRRPSTQMIIRSLRKRKVTVTHKRFPRKTLADVYHIRNSKGSSLSQQSISLRMELPPGDYVLVAQALLFHGGTSDPGPWAAFLTCLPSFQESTSGFLEGVAAFLPYNLILHAACHIAAGQPLDFTVGSSALTGFHADSMKLTAFRVKSLVVF